MLLWIRVLTLSGWVLGGAAIIYGAKRYWWEGSIPSGLISLAVVIVGPLEDILKAWVRRRLKVKEEPQVELVDVATSAAFLILLLLAVYLLPPR